LAAWGDPYAAFFCARPDSERWNGTQSMSLAAGQPRRSDSMQDKRLEQIETAAGAHRDRICTSSRHVEAGRDSGVRQECRKMTKVIFACTDERGGSSKAQKEVKAPA
jgi:hypothetical protein